MIHYLSARFIYPISEAPIKNGVIGVSDNGTIREVLRPEQAKGIESITYYDGVLVPGFVNTHCHLELSHLKEQIPENTGLPDFIKAVIQNRQAPSEKALQAMRDADYEMYKNGIVAVGDISNVIISKEVKMQSPLYYHTFVELLGFNKPSAPIIEAGLKLREEFSPLAASLVPHAPYSVSKSLFSEIHRNTRSTDLMSIHNQETEAEEQYFVEGTGKFADFFNGLGIAHEDGIGSGENSLRYHLPLLPKNVNTLLVHNTFVQKEDVEWANSQHDKLFWCLCPQANWYIERSLPDVEMLNQSKLKITLGTDSLASNHKLNMLSEMKILQDQLDIRFDQSIAWATLNGAAFLGKEDELGSFTIGKKPGVVFVDLKEGEMIEDSTKVKRLF